MAKEKNTGSLFLCQRYIAANIFIWSLTGGLFNLKVNVSISQNLLRKCPDHISTDNQKERKCLVQTSFQNFSLEFNHSKLNTSNITSKSPREVHCWIIHAKSVIAFLLITHKIYYLKIIAIKYFNQKFYKLYFLGHCDIKVAMKSSRTNSSYFFIEYYCTVYYEWFIHALHYLFIRPHKL